MSKVLLIAKSSDFENADYLDIRPLLVDAGVENFELIEIFETAKLREALPLASLVIATSGVFGDSELRRALNNELRPAWQAALSGECSVLILSQLLLAGSGEDLPGAPEELRIRPIVRPAGEAKAAGRFGPPVGAGMHQASVLPIAVDYAALTQRAVDSSLQGLYWHWWAPERPELWRTIVTDQANADGRPLVIEHVKDDGRSRVVMSSIALDRIRDPELLTNLIQLCNGGEYTVGFVENETGSIASGMLVASLQRAGERVFIYDAARPAEVALAAHAIGTGIHDSVLMSPSVSAAVREQLRPSLEAASATGPLRVVQLTAVEPAFHAAEVRVIERGTTADFEDQLAQTRWQLSAGLIGQSIFDTAKVLRVFAEVEPTVFANQDWGPLIADLNSRIRPDGTFESPAVPTAAFVYVASLILRSADDKDLRRGLEKSLTWLIGALRGKTPSNVIRATVYLAKAQRLGAPIPARFFGGRNGLGLRDELSLRDQLSLLEIALEGDDDDAVRSEVEGLLPRVTDAAVAAAGDSSDLLMAFTRAHSRFAAGASRGKLSAHSADEHSTDEHSADILSGVITRLANDLARSGQSRMLGSSFPTVARHAVALELYSRTVAVPTGAIVGMLASAHTEASARRRWADAVAFATTARATVTAAEAEQRILRRSVRSLRFQHRFSRIIILVLAVVAVGASALLFFAIEPDFTRLASVWAKFTSNWGVLSGLVTLSMTLAAWALYAIRSRPTDD